MDIVAIIKNLEKNKGNVGPNVVYYMQIALECRGTNIRPLLNEAVLNNKLMWGNTPETQWFATELSWIDRVWIEETSGWDIKHETNQ